MSFNDAKLKYTKTDLCNYYTCEEIYVEYDEEIWEIVNNLAIDAGYCDNTLAYLASIVDDCNTHKSLIMTLVIVAYCAEELE